MASPEPAAAAAPATLCLCRAAAGAPAKQLRGYRQRPRPQLLQQRMVLVPSCSSDSHRGGKQMRQAGRLAGGLVLARVLLCVGGRTGTPCKGYNNGCVPLQQHQPEWPGMCSLWQPDSGCDWKGRAARCRHCWQQLARQQQPSLRRPNAPCLAMASPPL